MVASGYIHNNCLGIWKRAGKIILLNYKNQTGFTGETDKKYNIYKIHDGLTPTLYVHSFNS